MIIACIMFLVAPCLVPGRNHDYHARVLFHLADSIRKSLSIPARSKAVCSSGTYSFHSLSLAGIEPASLPSEGSILSIRLQGHLTADPTPRFAMDDTGIEPVTLRTCPITNSTMHSGGIEPPTLR